MTDDPRVQQLLDELLDPHATPERVCATCPELLPVVRNRWQQMRLLRADLDALFPPPHVPSTKRDALFPTPSEPTPRPPEETALPRIPGYEVEGMLGRGGMGVVFKARHLKLNRLVALKMLLAGAYAGAVELARFRREAEAVAALRHPNIVQVHDAGEITGRPYFTMEFVEGGTLSQSLGGRAVPPARGACQERVPSLARAPGGVSAGPTRPCAAGPERVPSYCMAWGGWHAPPDTDEPERPPPPKPTGTPDCGAGRQPEHRRPIWHPVRIRAWGSAVNADGIGAPGEPLLALPAAV
jgi:hypothetical protein